MEDAELSLRTLLCPLLGPLLKQGQAPHSFMIAPHPSEHLMSSDPRKGFLGWGALQRISDQTPTSTSCQGHQLGLCWAPNSARSCPAGEEPSPHLCSALLQQKGTWTCQNHQIICDLKVYQRREPRNSTDVSLGWAVLEDQQEDQDTVGRGKHFGYWLQFSSP